MLSSTTTIYRLCHTNPLPAPTIAISSKGFLHHRSLLQTFHFSIVKHRTYTGFCFLEIWFWFWLKLSLVRRFTPSRSICLLDIVYFHNGYFTLLVGGFDLNFPLFSNECCNCCKRHLLGVHFQRMAKTCRITVFHCVFGVHRPPLVSFNAIQRRVCCCLVCGVRTFQVTCSSGTSLRAELVGLRPSKFSCSIPIIATVTTIAIQSFTTAVQNT